MVHFNREKDDIQLVHITEYILQGLEWDGAIQRNYIKMKGFFGVVCFHSWIMPTINKIYSVH